MSVYLQLFKKLSEDGDKKNESESPPRQSRQEDLCDNLDRNTLPLVP